MSLAETTQDSHARHRQAKLMLDQLALALRNLSPNHLFMPVFAAIVCVMFSRWVATARLEVWFALVLFSVVPLGIVSHAFRRGKPEPAPAQARIWMVRATLAYLVSVGAWASMAVFLWVPHDELNNLLVILLLACTIAATAALAGPSWPLAAPGIAIYGIACIVAPLTEGGLLNNGIAALAAVFIGYLSYMSAQIHATARDMLLLRNDKSDLIVALAQAKTESDTARDHAEAASRAKSQFLANMSHELRTPLNAILGFSELIASRAFHGDPEKHYEYAGLIHDSGHHLLTLINDILDLAKIEAGGFALREADVDLARLIGEVANMMAQRVQSGGCTLRLEIAPDLPNVLAGERAMKQILLNLLSNAVKFTPAGGMIEAFARLDCDGAIAFGVADNGMGIAKDDLPRVFQKFGQGQHDVAVLDKGTGLGLPIAKGLAEAHGGRITLESRVGHGTRVTVRFPAARARIRPLLRVAS